MRLGNPLPTSLPQECRKAARIFKSFANPSNGLDGLIPAHVLRSAHGFAIFTVVKAGFLMSVRAGTGLVIARLSSGDWSAPSAIGTGGMGFGGQAGAEVTEFILVLNSKAAIRQFMSAGSITLGGNMSVALGPIGRNAEGSGALNSKGKVAAMYSYSKSKGAFAGISIEGSAILERQDCNVKSYGSRVTATKLLSGQIDPPDFAQELIQVLTSRAGGTTEYIQRDPSAAEDFDDMTFPDTDQEPDSAPLSSDADTYPFGSFTSSPFTGERGRSNRSILPWKSGERPNSGKKILMPSTWRSKTGSDMSSQRATNPEIWTPLARPSSPPNLWGEDDYSFHKTSPHATSNAEKTSSTAAGCQTFVDLEPMIFGQIQQQITPIGERKEFDHSSPAPDPARLSFSSSGSSSGTHSAQTGGPLASNPPSRAPSAPTSSGMVEDLMSFDQINASPLPRDYFHSRSSSSGAFQNNTKFGIYLSDRSFHNASPTSNAPRTFERSNRLLEQPAKEAADFLVGTVMPSVTRTNTESVGVLGKATALYDFQAAEDGDLSFQKGETICILDKTDDQWWTGTIGMRKGLFPRNRVQACDP